MITKCPACGTTFRVTPEQLQVHQGTVRCGRCSTVFDGFRELASEANESRPQPRPTTVATARSTPAAHAPVDGSPPVVSASEASPRPTPEAPAVVAPREDIESRVETPALPPSQSETVVDVPQELLQPPRRRRAFWAFGIVLLVLVLAAQAAYLYRGNIATHLPEARPYLDQICARLHCTVALPQRPRSISIEASDLQATDPANPGLIVLTATLRNHAPVTVGYPALDVVLTNAKDHTVARRIFLPSEYLDPGKDARAGIAPNAEMTIKLDIDSGDLSAAGFRLDLLPAPAQ